MKQRFYQRLRLAKYKHIYVRFNLKSCLNNFTALFWGDKRLDDGKPSGHERYCNLVITTKPTILKGYLEFHINVFLVMTYYFVKK